MTRSVQPDKGYPHQPGSPKFEGGAAYEAYCDEMESRAMQPDNRQPYYAKDGMVWKHPVSTENDDGSCSISLGFPICTMHEAVGAEAAEKVAALMNAGHNAPAPIGPGAHDEAGK